MDNLLTETILDAGEWSKALIWKALFNRILLKMVPVQYIRQEVRVVMRKEGDCTYIIMS